MKYPFEIPTNVQRWQWKNQKRWIKQRCEAWCDENPNTVPPWLDQGERTQWYQAFAKAKQENEQFQSLVDRIEEEQRRRALTMEGS